MSGPSPLLNSLKTSQLLCFRLVLSTSTHLTPMGFLPVTSRVSRYGTFLHTPIGLKYAISPFLAFSTLDPSEFFPLVSSNGPNPQICTWSRRRERAPRRTRHQRAGALRRAYCMI